MNLDTKHTMEANHSEHDNFAPEYRDRLRTWLVKMIDSGTIPGLCWENEEKTIFRMPWKHAGRQDYNLEEDSKIFMAWAKHSGRYREGIDKPEPIVWKTRLRCALNKMPDIKELPSKSRLDISEPYRVYQLLPPIHKASQIRRRFYHRSHSQETSNVKGYERSSPTSDPSPRTNESSWAKKLSDQGLLTDTPQYNLPVPRTSPLLPGTAAVASPGLWFAPSMNVSMKTPMPAELLHLQKSNSTALNTISHLQTLAQARYPLVNSLHSPFSPFSSSTIPSLYHTSANMEALKQYGFRNPGYVNQLTEKTKEAEKQYKSQLSILSVEENSKPNKSPMHYDESEDAKPSKFSFNYQQESQNENKIAIEKNSFSKSSEDDSTSFSPDVRSLYFRLNESLCRIRALESDLKDTRTAHAQEREARETLEAEKEEMKVRLERMSYGLRELATHISPQDTLKYLENTEKSSDNYNQTTSTGHNAIRASSVSPVQNFKSNENYSGDESKIQRRSTSMEAKRCSPIQGSLKFIEGSSRKRPASPLDLTVRSPKKLPCCGDGLEHSIEIASKMSLPGFYHSTSPVRSLSSEDKRILSPFSSASGSPDSIGRSRSLSPLSAKNNIFQQYQQHHGTIQVL